MRTLVDVVGYANTALFIGVALLALREWRAGRGRASLWAALAFGALGVVVIVGLALPDDGGSLTAVIERIDVAILALFPYLLYRFTAAFKPPARGAERFLAAATVLVVGATFALPSLPEADEPRPWWFVAYLVLFLTHWAFLSTIVAWRLWRAGQGQPGVSRRRLRTLAVAALALTVALIVAGGREGENVGVELVVGLLATLSGVAFALGLAPPALLRAVWRRSEQEELQQAVASLITADSEEEVARRVLPPVARIVGARSVTLHGRDGHLLGSHEADDAESSGHTTTVHVGLEAGRLDVRASPYAPFFGTDERRLLETLGALTSLALDHARLFAGERAARAALERADELKTTFVAYAAHELRTPVTTVHGLVQTLDAHESQLQPERLAALREALRRETRRMTELVAQLLDLSRLDAEKVAIRPEPLSLRGELATIVGATVPERAGDVQLDVSGSLEAVVDRIALERIVGNLVANAYRYGEPPVVIEAGVQDLELLVAVRDHGAGVPESFVGELFERFTRSESAAALASGSGLGLAIAASYAKAHGGTLDYARANPRGARFELRLPMAQVPPAAPDPLTAGTFSLDTSV